MSARSAGASAGLIGLAVLLGVGAAAEFCEVRLSHGWASARGGYGTVYVVRNGEPCGDIIYAVVAERIPASLLRLASSPAHGEVAIEGAKFTYRPKAGFTGEDRFALVGFGVNRNGRPLRLRGLITVIVR